MIKAGIFIYRQVHYNKRLEKTTIRHPGKRYIYSVYSFKQTASTFDKLHVQRGVWSNINQAGSKNINRLYMMSSHQPINKPFTAKKRDHSVGDRSAFDHIFSFFIIKLYNKNDENDKEH